MNGEENETEHNWSCFSDNYPEEHVEAQSLCFVAFEKRFEKESMSEKTSCL